jgi:hypothetical protein
MEPSATITEPLRMVTMRRSMPDRSSGEGDGYNRRPLIGNPSEASA